MASLTNTTSYRLVVWTFSNTLLDNFACIGQYTKRGKLHVLNWKFCERWKWIENLKEWIKNQRPKTLSCYILEWRSIVWSEWFSHWILLKEYKNMGHGVSLRCMDIKSSILKKINFLEHMFHILLLDIRWFFWPRKFYNNICDKSKSISIYLLLCLRWSQNFNVWCLL